MRTPRPYCRHYRDAVLCTPVARDLSRANAIFMTNARPPEVSRARLAKSLVSEDYRGRFSAGRSLRRTNPAISRDFRRFAQRRLLWRTLHPNRKIQAQNRENRCWATIPSIEQICECTDSPRDTKPQVNQKWYVEIFVKKKKRILNPP